MKNYLLNFWLLGAVCLLTNCEPKVEEKNYEVSKEEKVTSGGLRYIHHIMQKKGSLPLLGDFLTLEFMLLNADNSDTLMNTYRETVDTEIELLKPPFPGGIEEALALVKEGDSLTIYMPAEIIAKTTQFSKKDKLTPILHYNIKVKKIETPEVYKERVRKRQAKTFEEQKELIRKHIDEKKLIMKEHPSGLFYKIDLENSDKNAYMAQFGDSIVFNYVSLYFGGSLVFDRTDDPKDPKKNNPIGVVLGKKRLIPAWEITFTQIAKEYEQVYITAPGGLAFGEKGLQGIPANAICEFLIRIVKIYKKEDLEKMRNAKK